MSPLLFVLLIAALVSGVSLALAAGGFLNLGKPSNDTPDFGPPIGGFHFVGTALTQHGKPELLFLTVPHGVQTDAEGWPLVKALEQFGTFSGLAPLPTFRCGGVVCLPPGFDFGHARYRSRYLAFVSKEILDARGRPFQHLSPAELALFNRYASPHVPGPQDYFTQAGLAASSAAGTRALPLIAIGGYLQTKSNVVYAMDFEVGQAPSPNSTTTQGLGIDATFADTQGSLATGKPVGGLQLSMIRDVDIESNIITALICRADGSQPRSVCGRTVIARLLRQVQ
jgi:hypothetical protein